MNEFILNSSTYELVLGLILVISFLIQLYYYLGVFLKVATKKNVATISDQLPPVSIVICARNEEDNLRNFLPKVLAQDYPSFEVVVVNDCSSDDTDLLLRTMMMEHANLRVTTIKEDEKFSHSKKLALTVGIKSAKNEWLLLTDADCFPESDQWLRTMASNFVDGTELVIGYGGFIAGDGLLNKIIRFDSFFNAMAYLGFAIKGKPYMAVGRNMAYRKELFFRNRGFASHTHILSGDDDLFVRDVATKKNTATCVDTSSVVRSLPQITYRKWVRQKSRHISTSKHYKFMAKVRIAMEPLSRFLFLASVITLVALSFHVFVQLGIYLFRLVVQLFVTKVAMKRLNEKKILLISPFWDFYSLFFYAKIHLINIFTSSKKKQWR